MNAPIAPDIPVYALVIRATWERGLTQLNALCSLHDRGAWLGPEQVRQAGLSVTLAKGVQFNAWARGRRRSMGPDLSGDLWHIARETGVHPMAIAWHLQWARSYRFKGWQIELA